MRVVASRLVIQKNDENKRIQAQISNSKITNTISKNDLTKSLKFSVYNHFHFKPLRSKLQKFRIDIFGQFCFKLAVFSNFYQGKKNFPANFKVKKFSWPFFSHL